MDYTDLINNFLYNEIPDNSNSEARFEAISKAVIGSKQRRYGPNPTPEIQVHIRKYINEYMNGEHNITVFSPWAASKQLDNHDLDILEIFALKQFKCLKCDLERFGVENIKFRFRFEDLADDYVFHNRYEQIQKYTKTFYSIAEIILGKDSLELIKESDLIDGDTFKNTAQQFYDSFLEYIENIEGEMPAKLKDLGWKPIPLKQLEYFKNNIPQGNTGESINHLIAVYFSAVAARRLLKISSEPDNFISIYFAHPIPGDPIHVNRLFYRTLPFKYTNIHRSPWIGKGYLEINGLNKVTPKNSHPNDNKLISSLIENTTNFFGHNIRTDYLLT